MNIKLTKRTKMSRLPYLLHVNEELVDTNFIIQSNLIPLYNALCQEIKKIGLECSLDSIHAIVCNYSGRDRESRLIEMVRNVLLEKMGETKINGVLVRQEFLSKMVEIPDLGSLKLILNKIISCNNYSHVNYLDVELVNIDENGNFSMKEDAEDILTERFSTYADNENQVSFHQKAKECSDIMTAFAKYSNSDFTFGADSPIKGIVYDRRMKAFIPDSTYIKQFI